jgi:hypothetical protein
MRASGGSLGRTVCALALSGMSSIAPASAAAVLRSAQVTITVPAPASCRVSMTLVVDGATSIDHRLEAPDGTTIDELRVQGAESSGETTIGRTRSLVLTSPRSPYTLSYRVQQPADRQSRCPLWLPAIPTDGVSRAVTLHAELPQGTTPGSTMPRFTWTGSSGSVTLAHLPAFVLLPFAAPGESPGWDITAVMDAAAVGVFVGASAIWLWREKKGRKGG